MLAAHARSCLAVALLPRSYARCSLSPTLFHATGGEVITFPKLIQTLPAGCAPEGRDKPERAQKSPPELRRMNAIGVLARVMSV